MERKVPTTFVKKCLINSVVKHSVAVAPDTNVKKINFVTIKIAQYTSRPAPTKRDRRYANMIKLHEFFAGYANIPLSLRMTVMDFGKSGMTLQQIYNRIKEFDDRCRDPQIEIRHLLEEVEPIIKRFL